MQLWRERSNLDSFIDIIRGKAIEVVGGGLSDGDGDGVVRGVEDGRLGSLHGPLDLSGEREVVEESERERAREAWEGDRVEQMVGYVGELVEEEALYGREFEPESIEVGEWKGRLGCGTG
ncbi:hypothetical protein ACOSQ3_028645 [Xanthoceras sorbifolium]